MATLLLPNHIDLALASTNGDDAISSTLEQLRNDPRVLDFDRLKDDIFAREKISPTTLGSGVAFPHARTDQVSEIVIAAGRSGEGVHFESASEKVRLIFVLGIPKTAVREYLRLLSGLTALLREPASREKLLKAATAIEFQSLLSSLF